MLRLIRKRLAGAGADSFSAPIEAPGLIYAVGDVHGRYDLLERLLDKIMDDAVTSGMAPTLVFMGDYIDRGEHARETLDMLINLGRESEAETVFLMGNHEQMLLRFLRDPETGSRWLKYGGLQTLMSYGVGGANNLRSNGAALQMRAALIDALGPHLGFIEGLRVSHQVGNLFFGHAGADPALPTDEQDIATILWGCENFRTTDRVDDVWVVHGHFVVERAAADRGRIAVDTGAYYSNRLTAARIVGGEVRFLQS